jgi:hypothetical protein
LRPQLSYHEIAFFVNSQTFAFDWNNLGKRAALGGVATLFALNDSGRKAIKLGEASIQGLADTATITPNLGYGGTKFDNVDIGKSSGSSFLVCTTYFDDTAKQYGQEFLFRLEAEQRQNQRTLLYDPSLSKDSPDCGADFPGRHELLICNLIHHLGL